MPRPRPLNALETLIAPAAIALDHRIAVAFEANAPCALPQFRRPCSPVVVSMLRLFPVEEPTAMMAMIHTQCGLDIAAEAAYRRWGGHPSIDKREMMSLLERFAADGFDESPCRDIEKIWRAGTELEAALILLRWTAVVYRSAHGKSDGDVDRAALSRLVAHQACRLLAVAETSLHAAHIRRRIDRLAPAVRRGRSMTETEVDALTADLPRKHAFARLDWPWLIQRMAVLGAGHRRPGDDRPVSTFH